MADESDVVVHASNAAATTVLVSTAQNGPAARRPQPTAHGPAHCHGISNRSRPLVFVNGAVASRDMAMGKKKMICLALGHGRAGFRLVIACFLCFVPALRTLAEGLTDKPMWTIDTRSEVAWSQIRTQRLFKRSATGVPTETSLRKVRETYSRCSTPHRSRDRPSFTPPRVCKGRMSRYIRRSCTCRVANPEQTWPAARYGETIHVQSGADMTTLRRRITVLCPTIVMLVWVPDAVDGRGGGHMCVDIKSKRRLFHKAHNSRRNLAATRTATTVCSGKLRMQVCGVDCRTRHLSNRRPPSAANESTALHHRRCAPETFFSLPAMSLCEGDPEYADLSTSSRLRIVRLRCQRCHASSACCSHGTYACIRPPGQHISLLALSDVDQQE